MQSGLKYSRDSNASFFGLFDLKNKRFGSSCRNREALYAGRRLLCNETSVKRLQNSKKLRYKECLDCFHERLFHEAELQGRVLFTEKDFVVGQDGHGIGLTAWKTSGFMTPDFVMG